MIDASWFEFLVDAKFAAIMAACFIFMVVIVALYLSQWACVTNQYWKYASIAAELMTALGLIGLITFAGRTFVDQKKAGYEKQVADSERKFGEALQAIGVSVCYDHIRVQKELMNSGYTEKLCSVWRRTNAMYESKIDWDSAHLEFSSLAQSANYSFRYSVLAKNAADTLFTMRNARDNYQHEVSWGDRIRPKSSWEFVFFAAVIAAIGVGLKIAKAISEVCRLPNFKFRNPLTRAFQ